MDLESTFTIGDRTFKLRALPPPESLQLLGSLTANVLPVVGMGVAALGNPAKEKEFFEALGRAAVTLPEVYRAFLKHCQVQWGDRGFAELATFERDVFARQAPLMLAWISKCLELEFADFFTGTGRDLVTAAASSWKSLIGLTGGSGGS